MLLAVLEDIRVRLEQELTRQQAFAELVKNRVEWLRRAHQEDDWELVSDLFAVELVALRNGLSEAHDSAIPYLAYFEKCPMIGRVAADLELLDVAETECPDTVGRTGEMAWTMGRSLEDGGQIKEALVEYLIGRAWLVSLPPEEEDPWMLSRLENCIGNAWRTWNQLERSLAAYKRGLKVELSDDPDTRGCLENNLGLTLRQLGRAEEAVEAFQRALELWNSDSDDSNERLSWLSAAESNLGNAYAQLGDAHRALARQRRTVHLSESLYEREPTVQNLDGLAGALSNLGNALRHQGMLDEGMEANKRARDLLNSAQQEGYDLRDRLATLELNLGNGLSMCQRYQEATVCYRSAIMIWRELYTEGRPGVHIQLGLTQTNLAQAFSSLRKHEEALQFQKVAIETLESSELQEGQTHHLAPAYGNLGYLYDIQDRLEDAGEAYAKARELWIASLETYPAGLANLAMIERGLASLHLEFQDQDRAVELLEEARERYQELVRIRGQLELRGEQAQNMHQLGEAHYQAGRYAKAADLLSQALEMWNRLDGWESEHEETEKLLGYAKARASEFG